jgi:hypothetical protein
MSAHVRGQPLPERGARRWACDHCTGYVRLDWWKGRVVLGHEGAFSCAGFAKDTATLVHSILTDDTRGEDVPS